MKTRSRRVTLFSVSLALFLIVFVWSAGAGEDPSGPRRSEEAYGPELIVYSGDEFDGRSLREISPEIIPQNDSGYDRHKTPTRQPAELPRAPETSPARQEHNGRFPPRP